MEADCFVGNVKRSPTDMGDRPLFGIKAKRLTNEEDWLECGL